MSQGTIDLVLLVKQARPELLRTIDTLRPQQWLESHTDLNRLITIDLAAMPAGDEVKTAVLPSADLQERISDVITCGDHSELRLSALAPSGQGENLATTAYYGLLAAISNI